METSFIDPELQRIATHIDKIRAVQYACSVNDVAIATRLNKSTAYRRLGEAREAGLVEWTDNVAGSVRSVGSHDVQPPASGWQQKLRVLVADELDDAGEFAEWLVDQVEQVLYPQPTESD
jgi:hypothetical protein